MSSEAGRPRPTDGQRAIDLIRFFVFTGLFFGIVYALLVPPFQVPDEVNHFKYAYHLSEGNFSGEARDDRLGGDLPVSLDSFAAIFRPLRFNYHEKSTADRRAVARDISLDPETKAFSDFPNVGAYAPTAYLPQAVFLYFGKMFDWRPLYLLYGSRLTGLFFWVTLVAFSLRLIPFKKELWLLCALLPSSVFINCGLTADLVTNAAAFLLTALLLRLIFIEKAKLSPKIGVLIVLLSLLIALNKFVYLPLTLLVFFIPKKKVTRRGLTLIVYFFLPVLVAFLFLRHNNGLFIHYDFYNPAFRDGQTINAGADSGAQISYILRHPFDFLRVMSRSWLTLAPANTAHYLGKFGWEKNYLPAPFLLLSLLLLLWAIFRREKKYISLPKMWKSTVLFIVLIISVLLSVTLYAVWNKVGADFMNGLQGRYFIPYFPLALMTAAAFFGSEKEDKPTEKNRFLRFLSLIRNPSARLYFSLIKVGIWLTLGAGVYAVVMRYFY